MKKNKKEIKYNPFPAAFEIQTATLCNGNCVICPYQDTIKKHPPGVMSRRLFCKIIDEISVHNHWGIKIIPYLNNESFLDPLFIERLIYINKKCPESEIEIATNLSLLDEKIRNKMRGIKIKELRISIFGFTDKTHKSVMPGISWDRVKQNLDNLIKDFDFRENVGEIGLVMINYPGLAEEDINLAKKYCKNHFLTFNLWGFLDRGGNVKAYSNNIYHEVIIGCSQRRPLERMHILFDGRVILCSMDWRQEYILGNLRKNTIQEIWNSPEYRTIRNRIYNFGTESPLLCKKCKLSNYGDYNSI